MCDPGSGQWSCTLLGCVDATVPRDGGQDMGAEAQADAPAVEACVRATCATLGYDCGYAADGCGGVLLCGGACVAPEFCGGAGFDWCGGCSSPGCACVECQPHTCAQQNVACGPASDGCGHPLDCGPCPGDGGACAPVTCAEQGIACGVAGDGCGGELTCGVCMPGESCGGGGVPGHCGGGDAGACPGLTCTDQGIDCGPAGDGFGGLLQCGSCPPPQKCGGGGFGRCG